jgi:hypothetical protein
MVSEKTETGDARDELALQRVETLRLYRVQPAVDLHQRHLGADRRARADRDEDRGAERKELEDQHAEDELERVRPQAVLDGRGKDDADDDEAQQRGKEREAHRHVPGGEIDLLEGKVARVGRIGLARDRRRGEHQREAHRAQPRGEPAHGMFGGAHAPAPLTSPPPASRSRRRRA